MKSFTRQGLFIFLIICFSTILSAQNVIIIVVDGARWSETFGGGNTYIPHIYDDMMPLGTLFTNYRIDYPSGYTETCPGHSAIESGTWQPIANNGSERPHRPTIFEYARKEDGYVQSDCYAVTGKSKLNILTYSDYSGYGSAFGGSWVGDDNKNDSQTFAKVISTMQTYHPKILVINFAEVDAIGHTGNWTNYLNAIKNVDTYVYQLWQHVQAGDYGYTTSNTTLFLTNDHGRHDDAHGGFTNHGDGCEGCEHIMLLALGRDVQANQVLDIAAWQIDIAPTVGELLDFQTPLAIGNSLLDNLTSVSYEENFHSLSEYKLEQNYPNPFNPSTKISYKIPTSGNVSLKIINLLGSEVTELINSEMEPGQYDIEFNAANLPSGVYFCRLQAGDFVQTRKMILLK